MHFVTDVGQNLQNSYFNELSAMYAKQKPVGIHPVVFFNL